MISLKEIYEKAFKVTTYIPPW